MKLSSEIDLRRSLRQVFGNKPDFAAQIEQDCARQAAYNQRYPSPISSVQRRVNGGS